MIAAFDALYEAQDDIRLIQTRHEQATTYMADGYARVTGKPGVAMVVPGPGAYNAGAGLGTAYAASSPVLLIAGQIMSGALGKQRGELHEVDEQLDVFKPITKWNNRVTRVEEIPEAVHEAMGHLKTGRPRPVELEVPPDTLAAEGNTDIIEPEEYPRASPASEDVARAARLLREAKRPAIIAGGGTIISGASHELLELAEFLQAPVMTSQQSKGILPEDHYLSVGTNYASVGPAHRVMPECDVLLAVGTRLLIRDLETETPPRLIHIDADATEIGKNLPAEVGIEADAKEALGALLRQLRAGGSPKESRRREIEGYKAICQGGARAGSRADGHRLHDPAYPGRRRGPRQRRDQHRLLEQRSLPRQTARHVPNVVVLRHAWLRLSDRWRRRRRAGNLGALHGDLPAIPRALGGVPAEHFLENHVPGFDTLMMGGRGRA